MARTSWSFTEADTERMASLYRRGMSLTQIGRRFRCNPHTVRYHVLRQGVPLRSRYAGRRYYYHGIPTCPMCDGGRLVADPTDGLPMACPECLGGDILPASVDDELGVA